MRRFRLHYNPKKAAALGNGSLFVGGESILFRTSLAPPHHQLSNHPNYQISTSLRYHHHPTVRKIHVAAQGQKSFTSGSGLYRGKVLGGTELHYLLFGSFGGLGLVPGIAVKVKGAGLGIAEIQCVVVGRGIVFSMARA